jgi:hypothetical protein
MQELKSENGITLLRFDRGEPFPAALKDYCVQRGLESGVVLCGIGMLENTTIGRYDGTEYARTVLADSLEVLSLQGNVSMKEGEPFIHLHVSLADHDFTARGGHLFEATVSMVIELAIAGMTPGLVRKPMGGAFWRLESAQT